MLTINHNPWAISANNSLKTTSTKSARSTEKLSSGYRINRAATDAAGLGVSEKMRRMIRGLDQGTKNTSDGVAWCQIGDGALNEAHDILQRMNELTLKSLNGLCTDEERDYLQMEFESLQCELDRIGDSTTFNEINVFNEYRRPHYVCNGAVKWQPAQIHVITAGSNDLTVRYQETEISPVKELTVTVPPGEYTTQELVDELDTALGNAKNQQRTVPEISLEYTKDGFCNALLQDGDSIDSVGGGLSYLIYDTYRGDSPGALIGTTSFPNEYDKLEIVAGKNDTMTFTIDDFTGTPTQKSIVISPGKYTRNELIDMLNGQLKDTTITASAYGTGIKLSSENAVVTGFKGNMFKIDNKDETQIYNSIFYDNVQYGSVSKTKGSFTGAAVLATDPRDKEHSRFTIDSTNNTLTLQPNGMEESVTLTLKEGGYDIEQMADALQDLFDAKDLNLNVKPYSQTVTSGGRSYTFHGLYIESAINGLESRVNIDPGCSAYKTLFETRNYNDYISIAVPVNETKSNSDASFHSAKALPPAIKIDGSNNKFNIAVATNANRNPAATTIEMTRRDYPDADALKTELEAQLGKKGLLELLDVSVAGGAVVLKGKDGKQVNEIRITPETGNNGYDDIFVGCNEIPVFDSESGSSITLNTPLPPAGKLEEDTSIRIQLGNGSTTVPLKKGDDQEDIKNKIEAAFPGKEETIPNRFRPVSGRGNPSTGDAPNTAKGTQSVIPWSDSAKGSSKKVEGTAQITDNIAACLVVGPKLKAFMDVGLSNNQINLNLNGTTKLITLPNGSYTPVTLKEELQAQIDKLFGTGMGGAIVSLDNDSLILTSRLTPGEDGADTSIQCSTDTSSFLKDLNTTKQPARWRSAMPLLSDIKIGSAPDNTFSFQYTEDGATWNAIDLGLTPGTYTPETLKNEIQQQLNKTKTGITVSLSGGKLVLTSAAAGEGVSIRYTHNQAGGGASAMFGELRPTPADIVVDLKLQDSIAIDDSSNQFNISINGTPKTVTLDVGNYDPGSFVEMLNGKLGGLGAEAYLTDGKLGLRTTATGSNASLGMVYDTGGSSMERIYGSQKVTTPGIKAGFEDGKLTLSSTDNKTNITVNTSTGGAFMKPVIIEERVDPVSTPGYHSELKSYLQGSSLAEPITIGQWNDELRFTFKNGSSYTLVNIEIPGKDTGAGEQEYTYDGLSGYLQGKINDIVGKGLINVKVDANGVRLEAADPGKDYQFSNFSGDFYYKVICNCQEQEYDVDPVAKDGTQTVNPAFTVGRKDVRNGATTIREGLSDQLSLDLTYDGVAHTISMVLDPGEYTGAQLKDHIQEKLDKALEDMGLKPGLIEVGIGDKNTGVSGANDENALSFSLSETVSAPSGQAYANYIIDGVKGNAAFQIFYETEGEIIPAYVVGTKDISKGVTIGPKDKDLSFKVDGMTHTITLPKGEYTADEAIAKMNELFKDGGVPLTASLDENSVKVSYQNPGKHTIEEVRGEARSEVFFDETGEKEEEEGIYVQVSSSTYDRIRLPKHTFSTISLKLNSLCISGYKYAAKAIERIADAIDMVSVLRTSFGGTQNRLEHAIGNNQNRSDGTQSAESRIRDTDMSREMVDYANGRILQRTGQAMQAQANQRSKNVLKLFGQE